MSDKPEANPTVEEIVRLWLKEHGYTGLRRYDKWHRCGCDMHDLLTCGEGDTCKCQAGYRVPDFRPEDYPEDYLVVLEKPA